MRRPPTTTRPTTAWSARPTSGANGSTTARSRATRARGQRRLEPGPARRVGGAARLGLPTYALARSHARARLANPEGAGPEGDRELAQARPRHLGGAWRAEALHLIQGHVLGGT